MRRLGHWLAILAIALHAAWPLLANARPKSVHLVPLCTVEGITHYLEIPGGNNPLDRTWIHPESYPLAEKIFAELGCASTVLDDKAAHDAFRDKLNQVNLEEMAAKLEQLRAQAKTMQQKGPAPRFSGVQHLIGPDAAPVVISDKPTTQP